MLSKLLLCYIIGVIIGYVLCKATGLYPIAGTLEIDKSKPTKDRYCFKFAIPLGDLEKMKHVRLTVKPIDPSDLE